MYSLNVAVPGRVARLAAELAPALAGFDSVRDQHTLVCKRLGDPGPEEYARVDQRVRRALAGTAPFEAQVAGVDYFERPATDPGPVVYLDVESRGLETVHGRLLEEFPPAEGVEGDDYVPHVTLARGGAVEDARRLADRAVEPVAWTVEELVFWDGYGDGGPAGRVRLPA